MRFFEHQDRARLESLKLICLFATALVLTSLSVNLILALAAHYKFQRPLDLSTHVVVGLLTTGLIIIASLYRLWIIGSQGGISMALELGGRNLDPSTQDPSERKILNLVEEMSIAATLPVPEVFLFEQSSINAFALGLNLKDAAVGLTTGAADHLNRDELQAVIAHELSHIQNGDMRLNAQIHSCIHGMMILSSFGRFLMGGRNFRSSRQSGSHLFVLGIAIYLLGSIGVLFGKLIQAAMSRQREYLADASAVQFTRNPQALSDALRKILGQSQNRFDSPWAQEYQHMFFAQQNTTWLSRLTASHPPLEQRIRRILSLPSYRSIEPLAVTEKPKAQIDFKEIVASNNLDPLEWLSAMSPSLRLALREVYSVRAVIYSLFIAKDPEGFASQGRIFEKRNQKSLWNQILKLRGEIDSGGSAARLPLIELSLPTLRRLSKGQIHQLFNMLGEMIACGQAHNLEEYTLLQILRFHLNPQERSSTNAPSRDQVQDSLVRMMGAFLYFGAPDPDTKNSLASRFVARWGSKAEGILNYDPGFDPQYIERDLKILAHLPLPTREALMNSIAECVLFDRDIRPQELELTKSLALGLNVPVSPLLRRHYLKVA